MTRQFNGYPISYLKAYLKKINGWEESQRTRSMKITALRGLTRFSWRTLPTAFRESWGLPPRPKKT